MSAKRRHWPMNQSPTATDPARQQPRIFILRRHDYAIPFKGPKILGKRERNSGTSTRKGCVSHRVLLEFRDVGNARIFNAPYLFRILLRIRYQRRLRINSPFVDPVGGTRGTKMRQAAAIFNATKQQGISICQQDGSSVEDTVNRIGPFVASKERIAGITRKQRLIRTYSCLFSLLGDGLWRRFRQLLCWLWKACLFSLLGDGLWRRFRQLLCWLWKACLFSLLGDGLWRFFLGACWIQ